MAATATPLPHASNSLAAPQWAIDMENRLTQSMKWEFHVNDIHRHNLEVAQREQSEWNHARSLNAGCQHDGEPLTPLPLPFPRLAVPAIPPLPAPGAAAIYPLPWAPPAIVAPSADPTFPATKGDLFALSGEALVGLLQNYGVPGANTGTVEDPRSMFARYIGVTL